MQAPAKAANKISLFKLLLASLSTILVTTVGISGGIAFLALAASSACLAAAATATSVFVGHLAAAVGAANVITHFAQPFVPAPPVYCSQFDRALAAGTGLLEACVASQTANTFSVIKTLRLVSKAASKIALQGITGYHIQFQEQGSVSYYSNLGAMEVILRSAKLTHLTITAPQPTKYITNSGSYSGTQHANNVNASFESLSYQLAHIVIRTAKPLESVTHLKLVKGSFSTIQHPATRMMFSRLATSLPRLRELSIDTDLGIDMLKTFGTLCPRLASLIVQDVGTLPFLTMQAMHHLMPNVTSHTVMCTYGDPSVLLDSINRICCPTTFDMCGRTMLLTSTLHIIKEGVTLQNGTFVVMEREDQHASLTAIQVSGCSVVLKDILLCGSLSKHSCWSEYPAAGDTIRSSMSGHVPTRWKGIHVHNRGSVVLHRCEIRGALAALELSSDAAGMAAPLGISPVRTCTLTAEHVTIHCGASAAAGAVVSGLRVHGRCCSAVLTHCTFINGGARTIAIEDRGHLTAKHVSISSDAGQALTVTGGSFARLTACKVSGRSPYNVLVSGFNSMLCVLGCQLGRAAHCLDMGRVEVLD